MTDLDTSSKNASNMLRAEKLMAWMMIAYPSLSNTYNTDDKIEAATVCWDEAIHDLTDEEVRTACRWCKNSGEQYAPSTARFRHKAKGLPDSSTAFAQSHERNENYHPAVREAKRRVGKYHYQRASEEALRKRFLCAYGMVCEEIMSGASYIAAKINQNRLLDNAGEEKKSFPSKAIASKIKPDSEASRKNTEQLILDAKEAARKGIEKNLARMRKKA